MSDTKKRKRLPLSCLQCKRRKVKCDKTRPACGGCVRNGVGHRCEFVDPVWLTGIGPETVAAAKETSSQLPEADVATTALVERQRTEIDKLRREVNVLRQVYSSKLKSLEADSEQITVLQKLRNINREPDTIEFEANYSYSLVSHTNSELVQFFCWENVINLDPKLTDLWFRVSSIQKAYHQYKASRNLPATSSVRDEPRRPSTPKEQEKSPMSPDDVDLRAKKLPGSVPVPEYYYPSIELLKRIQNVWQKILSLSLPDEKLTCAQLTFILDSYFSGTFPSATCNVLHLYESRVRGLFANGAYGIQLKIDDAPSGDDDSARFHYFRFLLVYLCMMGIMVEEMLEHFRLQIRLNVASAVAYKEHFSNRVLTHANGHSRVTFCLLILKTLEYVHTPQDRRRSDPVHQAFPFYSCCVALLNRMTIQFCPRLDHLKDEFRLVFNMLVLELICDGEIPLWTNPKNIHAQKPGLPEAEVTRFRASFGLLWSEIVRIFNLQVLQILFSKTAHKQQLQLFNMIWDKISNDPDRMTTPSDLGFSFAANVLICRITSCLHGSTFDHANKYFLTTANVFGLINECSAHLEDPRLHKLTFERRFEYSAVILFLRYYLSYINILQGEECGNSKVSEFAEIGVVQNAVECLQHLSKCVRTDSSIFTVYLTSEILPYAIQFNIGTIVRLEPKDRDSVSRIAEATAKVVDALTASDPADYCNYKRFTKMWNFFQKYVRNTAMLSPEEYANLHAGVPSLLGGCPVMLADPSQKPDPNGPHGSCPVSGICQVETELISKKSASSAKCPVDHSSMARGKTGGLPLSRPPTPFAFPALTPVSQTMPPEPYLQLDDIDWSSFEHFDLDILTELSFM